MDELVNALSSAQYENLDNLRSSILGLRASMEDVTAGGYGNDDDDNGEYLCREILCRDIMCVENIFSGIYHVCVYVRSPLTLKYPYTLSIQLSLRQKHCWWRRLTPRRQRWMPFTQEGESSVETLSANTR